MKNSLTPDEAVGLAGSQTLLAKILGVSRQTVWNWIDRGKIPAGGMFRIATKRPEWLQEKKQ